MRTNLAIALFTVSLVGTAAFAQDDAVTVSLETYVVSEVTADDGSKVEELQAATTARPGQVVEYQLTVSNGGVSTMPAGSVVLTGPVPETTAYIDGSATPTSEVLLTEFIAAGTSEYSEAPVIVTVTNANGRRRQETAAPEDYTAVRWTLLTGLEAGKRVVFTYRVVVQ